LGDPTSDGICTATGFLKENIPGAPYYVLSDMANVINNTDLDKISQTVANGKRDKESLRRPVKMNGEWNLDPTKGYQFRTELSFEKGI
jgi:hypothetical protein